MRYLEPPDVPQAVNSRSLLSLWGACKGLDPPGFRRGSCAVLGMVEGVASACGRCDDLFGGGESSRGVICHVESVPVSSRERGREQVGSLRDIISIRPGRGFAPHNPP